MSVPWVQSRRVCSMAAIARSDACRGVFSSIIVVPTIPLRRWAGQGGNEVTTPSAAENYSKPAASALGYKLGGATTVVLKPVHLDHDGDGASRPGLRGVAQEERGRNCVAVVPSNQPRASQRRSGLWLFPRPVNALKATFFPRNVALASHTCSDVAQMPHGVRGQPCAQEGRCRGTGIANP